MSFVHLHVHSEFSLADGILKVKKLVQQAAAEDMPAVALTDINNMFALVKFYEACLSNGVKPILGAELHLAASSGSERIVVLAMNSEGYANLRKLVSFTYTATSERGLLDESVIFEHQAGLIVLSGGIQGHLWSACEQKDHEAFLKSRDHPSNCHTKKSKNSPR